MDRPELIDGNLGTESIPPVEGSGFVVGAVFLLFGLIEADFLANLHTLYLHHMLLDSALQGIEFQLNLIVALLCFWRLWRKKFVIQTAHQKRTMFDMYLSVIALCLLTSLFLFREIGVAVYQANHQLGP